MTINKVAQTFASHCMHCFVQADKQKIMLVYWKGTNIKVVRDETNCSLQRAFPLFKLCMYLNTLLFSCSVLCTHLVLRLLFVMGVSQCCCVSLCRRWGNEAGAWCGCSNPTMIPCPPLLSCDYTQLRRGGWKKEKLGFSAVQSPPPPASSAHLWSKL